MEKDNLVTGCSLFLINDKEIQSLTLNNKVFLCNVAFNLIDSIMHH